MGDSRYFFQNELDKACCQHDIAYIDFDYRTASDKILRDNVLLIFSVNMDQLFP